MSSKKFFFLEIQFIKFIKKNKKFIKKKNKIKEIKDDRFIFTYKSLIW